MAYQHRWYIPQRVIYSKLEGDLDIEEITRFSHDIVELLDQGTPLVHIMLDTSGVGSIPIKLNLLGSAVAFTRHAALGWTLIIGGDGSRIKAFIVDMVSKISHNRLHRVSTFEEGIIFLRERDITIPWHEADEQIVTSS